MIFGYNIWQKPFVKDIDLKVDLINTGIAAVQVGILCLTRSEGSMNETLRGNFASIIIYLSLI